MASFQNLLGLPQDIFGSIGIKTGNHISQQIEKRNDGRKAVYSPMSRKITILNSSDLPSSILHKILYESPAHEYTYWYPVVIEQRNEEGNLEINLSSSKPLQEPSSHNQLFLDYILNLKALGPILEVEEEAISQKEVEELEKTIVANVINAMSQFFNKHEMGNGVWNPYYYSKYLIDEFDIELDPSFFTGFANEAFFEKTARYTFELKEGKKASDALLSFLNGPTVADCGNATMACYYKCILDIIGEEKFNQLFSSSFKLRIGQEGVTDIKSPTFYLSDFTDASKQMLNGIKGQRPLKVGDECHFDGVPWYSIKLPEGPSGGWNAIYIGDNEEGKQLFIAHGFEKPLTENEINQKFIERYNQERTAQDENHIREHKQPTLFDKETNRHLKLFYTIPVEVALNASGFIQGFLVGSGRNLSAKNLIRLKNAKNVVELMLELIDERLSSLRQRFPLGK